jgi:hypothetical protein
VNGLAVISNFELEKSGGALPKMRKEEEIQLARQSPALQPVQLSQQSHHQQARATPTKKPSTTQVSLQQH